MVVAVLTHSRTFLEIVRKLDIGEIRRQLAAPARILIAAADPEQARSAAECYFGPSGVGSWSIAITALADGSALDDRPDLVLALLTQPSDRARLIDLLQSLQSPTSIPIVAILADGMLPSDDHSEPLTSRDIRVVVGSGQPPVAEPRRVVRAVLERAPVLALPLGRRFPSFRDAVAQHVILETSRANAQFALLSGISGTLPLIGGVLGGTADLLVLTKNQALMLAKLAGIHGRDLEDRVALALEVAPVVGGAFVWRGLARTALGFVPAPVGVVPKAVVAFTGTYIEGQLAAYYYQTGRRPSPALTRRIEAEARRLALDFVGRIARWPRQHR